MPDNPFQQAPRSPFERRRFPILPLPSILLVQPTPRSEDQALISPSRIFKKASARRVDSLFRPQQSEGPFPLCVNKWVRVCVTEISSAQKPGKIAVFQAFFWTW
jgi:hypothetical protein